MYIKSESINMYPSALRGGTDSTNNTVPINPEARLNSEFNITNPVNRLTIDGSFVISLLDDNLEFSIHGYYFKLTGIKDIFKDMANGAIWASIKLKNFSSGDDYSLLSLTSWNNDTNLDRLPAGGENFEFTGLDITNTPPEKENNVFSLHILDKSGTDFTIPEASLLRFDPNHIQIDDGMSLHDVIYNNNKLTIKVDEFEGHLTGDVTGNLDGNAKTATDSGYATLIGTSEDHPQVGNELKPVYINSKGKIVPITATKGGYNRLTYFEYGEIKEGAKITISNRAPIDGQDEGKEGDIWFQYIGN